MTELELKTKQVGLQSLKEQERAIHKQIKDIEAEIEQHYLDEAKKPYADLNVGDKVIVHEKDWTGKVIQHEPAFFYDVRYSRYSFHNPDCIELVLHKAKKDGTMSKLEKSIYVRRIVAVQKVTE